MNNSYEGIVIRHQDYRDNDVILNVFTKENGKMSFLARGLKKAQSKNASSCALFTFSVFHFNENTKSNMQSLKTAERKEMFRNLYNDLVLQTIAQIMCECIEKIANGISEELFIILYKSLNYLNTSKKPYVVLGLFLALCNEFCGISPNVDDCVKCHRQDMIASISLRDGGFLCVNCMDSMVDRKSNEKELRNFRLLHKARIDDFSILEEYLDCNFEDLQYILSIFEEYSGVHLKSVEFLRKINTL